MGYEGHIVGLEDRAARATMLEESMAQLTLAAGEAGGEVISAGGTGTYDLNTWATEIRAGSCTRSWTPPTASSASPSCRRCPSWPP